eukprot:14218067-Alexandrium_andersonii.AAC.1
MAGKLPASTKAGSLCRARCSAAWRPSMGTVASSANSARARQCFRRSTTEASRGSTGSLWSVSSSMSAMSSSVMCLVRPAAVLRK